MAKLNRQEINALSNKLHRELKSIVEESKQNLIKNYVPSENYKIFEELLSKGEEAKKKLKEAQESYMKAYSDVNKFAEDNYKTCVDFSIDSKYFLNLAILKELGYIDVPTLEQIKEDIIIASIETDFNVEDFLNKQLENYKSLYDN